MVLSVVADSERGGTTGRLAEVLGVGRVPLAGELSRPWPIPGIVHPSLTCITGQPFAGKTTLAIALVRTLLKGESIGPWQPAPFQRRAMFLAETVDAMGMAGDALAAFGDRVEYGVTHRWPHVSADDFRDGLRNADIGLLVVDSAFSAAGDVNDQANAANVLDILSGAGVPVVVLHHEPKGSGGGGPAGAQMWVARYRHILHVSRLADSALAVRVLESNNWPSRDRWSVTLDRDPLRVRSVEVVGRPASREPKSPRMTAVERACALGALAADLNLNTDGITPGAIATLLRGARKQPDSTMSETVRAAAWPDRGAPPTWETVRNTIQSNRADFDLARAERLQFVSTG